jgi:hypothetical protein
VFGKLISRVQGKIKKSDHPLGSDANLDALIADISLADPGRVLLDVDHWLADADACVTEIGAEATLQALFRLDEFSRAGADELLDRYLSVGKREYMADSIWSALETHAAHLFEGYKAVLSALQEPKSDKDKTGLVRCAARALRAWALRKKLQRFRYRTPGAELWRDAHDMLLVLGRLGLQQASVTAYRDETPTTPLREYLIGLYLEFVPLGNMVPQQLELAERFLRSCEGLELSPQPHQLSTDRIDLAAGNGPQRLKEDDAGGDSVRYCSVLKLRVALMKFAALAKKPDAAPAWLATLPATPDQIRSGIVTLMTYWATTPPTRSKDRFDQKVELRVVFGFVLARRMIAASHFARKGRSFKYEGDDVYRLFEESRFGRVAQAGEVAEEKAVEPTEPEVSSPLDILRKLELRGDQAQMETWKQVDESTTGFGVVVPAVLPRHRIGLLICLRHLEGMDWRMGLIRRIGRDAANRPSIGIETLAWPSICAQAKPAGDAAVWAKAAEGGQGWLDAIVVSKEGKQIILPAGAFVAGMEIDIRSEEGLWRVRLESLLDQGADYDRIEFTRT